jgi:hypothetical protein
MNVPSTLLLRYFELAFRRLQDMIDAPSQGVDDVLSLSSPMKLDWHRRRIIDAQKAALDKALETENGLEREKMQLALRQIGEGDFSSVAFDVGNADDQKHLVTKMMEKTNEMARKAFSHSVICEEWKYDHLYDRPEYGTNTNYLDMDKLSILEYCALAISAVSLEMVQKFLERGRDLFPVEGEGELCSSSREVDLLTPKGRLEYIQRLIWRALDRDPEIAPSQFHQLFSEESHCSNAKTLMNDGTIVETLTKYASCMTVAINNATTVSHADDGTTRIINVSYSEKIVTVPESGNGNAIPSLSAPTSNSIHDHTTTQQRQQLEIAQQTAMLQQQIWDEFESLSASEQAKTLVRAEAVQKEFLERIMSTQPGPERVLLMQTLNGDDQRLLVVHKMWCSRNSK